MRYRSILRSAVLLSLVLSAGAGCLERPLKPQDTHSTAMLVEPLKLSAVERIDLLLAIDNSASMGDKQEILARAVPDLVKRLANPRCVDGSGAGVENQPESPTALCPPGSEREFLAVPDIHIGIVSSSLGGTQNGACSKPKENDKAHLLSRTKEGGSVPTYGGHGFLAWDPDQKLDPAGESLLDSNGSGLVPTLQDMVLGVGESGCGFEGTLESWYRFLIDPNPYETMKQVGDKLVPTGTDQTVLDQRRQFLRPDSLVAIVMLSDENDCSIAPGDDAAKVYSAQKMVRPRVECASNADDPCCAPCDAAPAGCAVDPTCTDEEGQVLRLDASDAADLRCFNQKRRFGKDYLYPIERYVRGLSELLVPDREGEMTANPLFMDLNPDDDLREVRGPELVFLTGIVGVPWQDIAKDPTQLAQGLKSAKELRDRDSQGRSAWDVILGDPVKGTAPLDPHMIETTEERSGQNPITGTDMAPSSAGPNADPISGHEQPESSGNVQYACIFPLLSPIDCSGQSGCGCNKPDGNPLCQDASGTYSKTQLYGKAYPGVRELAVLQGVKDQAIVASVCPANMDEASAAEAADFGYRPAIGALVDQLKDKLGYQCLSRKLTPNDDGQVSCLVLEARKSPSCSCNDADGRMAVEDSHVAAIQGARESGVISDSANCFCEIPQLDGGELLACQTHLEDPIVLDGDQVDGWCYVDATSTPPVGNPDLVPTSCASTERQLVRLVGNAKARPGSTLFIMCSEG